MTTTQDAEGRVVGRDRGAEAGVGRRRLRDHYWAAAGAFTAFMTLAYLRLAPFSAVTPGGGLSPRYQAWSYDNLAYSDVLALYNVHHLFTHAAPYVHVAIEYPVLMGLYMWLAAYVPGVQGYFALSALGLLASGLITLRLLKDLRPSTYHWFALTPLLFVFGLLNWDLFGILLLVLAWWLLRRDRPGLAGAALALGVFAKLFPIVAAPFMLAELVRAGRRREARRFVVAGCGVSVAVNLPFMALGFHNWTYFFRYNFSRHGPGSVLGALKIPIPPNVVWTLLIAIVVLGAGAVLVRHVLRGGSAERATAYAFAVFLLANKVYSPQYMLWLVPMAILAEWPAATIWALSLGGVVDYYNSITLLHLLQGQRAGFAWYDNHLFHWGARIRYAAIVVATASAAATGLRARAAPTRADPPAARAEGVGAAATAG